MFEFDREDVVRSASTRRAGGHASPSPDQVGGDPTSLGNGPIASRGPALKTLAATRIQRKDGGGPSKPKARVRTTKRSLTKALEESVDDKEHQGIVSPKAKALYDEDQQHYTKLILYKLNKHATSDAEKARLYRITVPDGGHWPIFELAWNQRNATVAAMMFDAGWGTNPERCKAFALQDPPFFVTHCLLDGARQREGGRAILIDLVKERRLLSDLRDAAPRSYAALVQEIPLLRLVEGVAQEVAAEAEHGPAPDVNRVVRKVFDAFVNNRGIDVAYSGTKVDQNPTILTGQTAADVAAREEQRVRLQLPEKLSTACHELLHLLRTVLESMPGLDDVVITGADEQSAVLTVPLNTLDGGLIKSNYTGNVFNAAGQRTNQIFFSGDRAKVSKSHSWLVVNNIAYDPVLGTVGDAVEAAIHGKFEFNDGDENPATEIGGARALAKETQQQTTGEYGLTSGWRLAP